MKQEIISTTDIQLPQFSLTLDTHNQALVRHSAPSTAQINLGKLCNLACHHCHVEAGPKRTEIMTDATIARLLAVLADSPSINTVDLTGGAPELNPHFEPLVTQLRTRGYHVIDRCNLTVLYEVGQENTAAFLADNQVEVVASLPCYSELNVDAQRGSGSFSKSIQALQLLNGLGYGRNNALPLNLVYNPTDAYLPPSQATLEAEYRQRLSEDFGIQFNHLLTITNMPIKRFEHQLIRANQYDDYMDLLFNNFNAEAAKGIMCKDIISVSWDGQLYDCDFNQMLEIPLHTPRTLWDINSFTELQDNPIETNKHCYGCTAGTGSSCSGATI
mgnify:CR=1 FL=1